MNALSSLFQVSEQFDTLVILEGVSALDQFIEKRVDIIIEELNPDYALGVLLRL